MTAPDAREQAPTLLVWSAEAVGNHLPADSASILAQPCVLAALADAREKAIGEAVAICDREARDWRVVGAGTRAAAVDDCAHDIRSLLTATPVAKATT